jgi:Putative zinc-finger
MRDLVQVSVQGMIVPHPACERARRLASLRPDGETNDLEEAFITSHLAECPPCQAYAEAVEASTAAIRGTELLEAPALRVAKPSRRRIPMRALQAAAAAAIVATAGLSGLSGLPEQQREDSLRPAQRPGYLDSATYELRLIEDLARTRVRGYPGSRIAT